MKKLSLEMLRLTSDEVLGRSQMKSVIGGAMFRCTCYNSVGSWTGNYSDKATAEAYGGGNCASGIAQCREINE
jgi:natural product precursor